MQVVVYVETNFLMSMAMGREPNGADLINAITSNFRIVIPTGCYMEAFSAFKNEQKKRNRFKSAIDERISDLERDKTSENARKLLSNLEQCRMDNDRWLNDIQERLIDYIDIVFPQFEQIPLTPFIVRKSVSEILIRDPTDNLILHSILEDARVRPADAKLIITGNSRDFSRADVEAARKASGIEKYFTNANDAIEWVRNQRF